MAVGREAEKEHGVPTRVTGGPGPDPVVFLDRPPDVVLPALEDVMRDWFHAVERAGDAVAGQGGMALDLEGSIFHRSVPAGYFVRVAEAPGGSRIGVELRTRDMRRPLARARRTALVNIEDVLREVAAVLHARPVFVQGGRAAVDLRRAAWRWARTSLAVIVGVVLLAIVGAVVRSI